MTRLPDDRWDMGVGYGAFLVRHPREDEWLIGIGAVRTSRPNDLIPGVRFTLDEARELQRALGEIIAEAEQRDVPAASAGAARGEGETG